MRHTTLAALIAATLTAALTACGGSTTAPASPPTTVTVEVPAPAASHLAAAPAPVAASAASSWTMPNLVGVGLQEAQDSLQALTDYGVAVTTSHDAAGAGRMQVSDRNWKVCSQSVAPGSTITSATPIDFGAVKLEEDC